MHIYVVFKIPLSLCTGRRVKKRAEKRKPNIHCRERSHQMKQILDRNKVGEQEKRKSFKDIIENYIVK